MVRAGGTRGWHPFWPELEPRPKRRSIYCFSCKRNGGPYHLSSQRHRRSTAPPRMSQRPIRPDRPRRYAPHDEGTPAQNRAAAIRLGIAVPA